MLKSAIGQFGGIKLGGVATTLFGAIHRNVRVLDQRRRVVTVFRENADANADADEKLLIQRHRRFTQVFKDLIGDIQCCSRIANALHENQELVAPEAGDGIRAADELAHPHRHFAEYAVADIVAETVVDLLEAIEVDEQYGESRLLAAGALQCDMQPIFKQQAVRQPGERVVMGLVVELFVGCLDRCDIGENADIVGDGAG